MRGDDVQLLVVKQLVTVADDPVGDLSAQSLLQHLDALRHPGRALVRGVGVRGEHMHEPPRDEFAELLAELCILQQGPGVDLRVSTGSHPLIQQGGVVQHIGVTLNVRDQRQDALFLQSVQGLFDKMRLMGGGKLHEHVGGVAHAEGLGVQLTELGRKVNFAAQLEPEVHPA